MTYFHVTTETCGEEFLKTGFISLKTMEKMERDWRFIPNEYDNRADCRTIVCDTVENAIRHGRSLYGEHRDLVILEIEGDSETKPLIGTMVPENTVFLHGEISPAQIKLHAPEQTLSM